MILTTHTGRIDIVDPRPDHIRPDDLAHHLARRQRWNGATARHWSVADHSVMASRLADEYRHTPLWSDDLPAWCLLHDAAEAYLPDVPRPCRRGLGWMTETGWIAFDAVEVPILRAVAERFGLTWPIPAGTWHVDDRLLATEARDLMPGRDIPEAVARPFDVSLTNVTPHAWRESRDAWIARLRSLTR